MTPYYVGALCKKKKSSFPSETNMQASVEGEKVIFRKKQQIFLVKTHLTPCLPWAFELIYQKYSWDIHRYKYRFICFQYLSAVSTLLYVITDTSRNCFFFCFFFLFFWASFSEEHPPWCWSFPSREFGKVCRVLLHVNESYFFHLHSSRSGCPFDQLKISPHREHVCVCVCLSHANLAHCLPTILLFLSLVNCEGTRSWNKICLSLITGLFSTWHKNIPFSASQLTPHSPTSCVAVWCRGQVDNSSIHMQSA